MSSPDFQIRQAGSFSFIKPLSKAAREARGELFDGVEVVGPAEEWRASSFALAPLLERLRGAGFVLVFK